MNNFKKKINVLQSLIIVTKKYRVELYYLKGKV